MAATSDPYTYTQASLDPHRIVIVGATLGNDWSGFPTLLATDYAPVNPPYEKLDVELPLYVTWILDTSGGCTEVCPIDPPQPITSLGFYSALYNGFEAKVTQNLSDVQYYTCPEGVGLEAPQAEGSFPLTADGKLRVSDTHGGLGSQTVIHLWNCEPVLSGDPCGDFYNIMVSWAEPRTWYDDYLEADVDRAPGTVYNRAARIDHGGRPWRGYIPVRIVEWVSTDFGVPGSAGPSPRYVDAGDLAYWVSFCDDLMGQHVRWGFAGETPPNSPTYHCNVHPWGVNIDASDQAVFYADLGNKSCQLSKAGDDTEFAAMLEWFGVAPTGELAPVNPNGELLPVYRVVDWEKARRAIVDPYGYRKNLNLTPAKEAPWGLVKQLYRD